MSIRQGLIEAITHARDETTEVKVCELTTTVDVAALRARLGLTQAQFAARFGFSVAALRDWERGDRRPRGQALVLLNLIDREPEAVMRALVGTTSASAEVQRSL